MLAACASITIFPHLQLTSLFEIDGITFPHTTHSKKRLSPAGLLDISKSWYFRFSRSCCSRLFLCCSDREKSHVSANLYAAKQAIPAANAILQTHAAEKPARIKNVPVKAATLKAR